MLIKDKKGMLYLVWSINKKKIFQTNKVNCSDVICGKKTCDKCMFKASDIGLSEFEIIK